MSLPAGISISGLDQHHQDRIHSVGLWRWMDEQKPSQPIPAPSKAAPQPKTAGVWTAGPFGVTLHDLKTWSTDRLIHLAQRMSWPSISREKAEIFVEHLNRLLPRATEDQVGQIVTSAWKCTLQNIENKGEQKLEKEEKRHNNVFLSIETSPTGVPTKASQKGRKKGLSPERLSPYQAVKAHQKSGNKLCFICHRPETSPHHIIPRSEGGLPLSDNIMWLCNSHHDAVEGPYAGVWERIRMVQAEYVEQENR